MAHEDLAREQRVEGSSDRAFGVVFAAFFFILGLWPLLDSRGPRWWALALAALFALVSWLGPALLAPANRQWTRLGVLLGRIVSPVALAILFYGVLTPLGALMRLTGKDPLRRKLDPAASSYWLGRTPPGPPPDSMTNQF